MAKIEALFPKSLTFLSLILNFPHTTPQPPPPLLGLPEKYTPMGEGGEADGDEGGCEGGVDLLEVFTDKTTHF